MDILGPYHTSKSGNRFVIVAEDLFSKWVEARATKEAGTAQVRAFLENEIIPRFGCSKFIISDNGPAFTSNEYVEMCENYGIKPIYTAVYCQRENPVERKIAELKKTLRVLQYSQFPRDRWDEYIQPALGALRSRKNRATGETPSKALLGYEIAKRGQWNIDEYGKQRQREKRDAAERRKIIRTRQLDFQEKTYPRANEGPSVTFRKGDKVMLKEYNPTDPFAPVWSGPHVIAVRKSAEIYEVDKNGRQFQYHVDQLRPAPPGNPDEPEDLPSDEEPPVPPDDSSSEDEEPITIVTTAQVHDPPVTKERNRPADAEVEPLSPSTSGKSVTYSEQEQEGESTTTVQGHEPMDTSTADSRGPDSASERDLVEEDRPRSRTPPEFYLPGPIILRRPRTWGRRWSRPDLALAYQEAVAARARDQEGECAHTNADSVNSEFKVPT